MTLIDDQLLAEELRSIFEEHSAHGATVADRRADVGRRITRHKRIRALSAVAAVLLAAGSAVGAVTLQQHHGAPVQPAVTASPTTLPGQLSEYLDGGHLVASATIDVTQQTAGSFTFTPTSWDMAIGDSCAATGKDAWLDVRMNGHDFSGSSCGPDGGSGTASGSFGQHEKFWRGLGVALGVPSTVTFKVGTQKPHSTGLTVTPIHSGGLASVGVYNPVPFDKFPLPPKPADWSGTSSMGFGTDPGMRKIAQIGDFGKTDVSQPLGLALPSHLEIIIAANAPGLVRLYINGVEVGDCSSYGWGSGCDGGNTAVGTAQLAGLTKGQQVVVTVQTDHFTVPNAVEILIYGK